MEIHGREIPSEHPAFREGHAHSGAGSSPTDPDPRFSTLLRVLKPLSIPITQKTHVGPERSLPKLGCHRQGREEKGREKGIIDPPFSTKCLQTNN